MPRSAAWAFVAALAVLSLPAAGRADHVTIAASVTATLEERTPSGSWVVKVTWSAECLGAAAGDADYQGTLRIRDLEDNTTELLGGTSVPGGTARKTYAPRDKPYAVRPELSISCFESGSLHGSGALDTQGGSVLIPARADSGQGSASGEGGGSASGGDDPTAPLSTGGCRLVLQGTDEPDVLHGTGQGDVVFGYRGDDRLLGKKGHDCLLGGEGDDVLEGGRGNDRLTGGSGDDRLIGGRGNDRLVGGRGNDTLVGGRGNDTLVGGPGVNVYLAGPGDDVVRAANGRRETIRCGPGDDVARVDREDRVFGCERVIRVS